MVRHLIRVGELLEVGRIRSEDDRHTAGEERLIQGLACERVARRLQAEGRVPIRGLSPMWCGPKV